MTYRKKLIEVALPLEAINRESMKEKSIRLGNTSMLSFCDWSNRLRFAVQSEKPNES